MGLTGDESEELPYLEIDPPERLFDLIVGEELCEKSFRSELFGRPVRIEFGSDAKCTGPPWAKIYSADPQVCEIKIGLLIDSDGGTGFFRAWNMTCITDDDCLFRVPAETKKQAMLEYLQCTMEYGFVLYWKGRRFKGREALCGPLRSDTKSRGWLKQWLDDEEAARTRFTKQCLSRWYEGIPIVLLAIVFSPLILLRAIILFPWIILGVIKSRFPRPHHHARRYPPFPLN